MSLKRNSSWLIAPTTHTHTHSLESINYVLKTFDTMVLSSAQVKTYSLIEVPNLSALFVCKIVQNNVQPHRSKLQIACELTNVKPLISQVVAFGTSAASFSNVTY
jgi:hypothetical protein